jgi:hypothetical protein
MAGRITRVRDEDRELVAALDSAWTAFRRRDRRIPRAAFTVHPRRPSNCNTLSYGSDPISLSVNPVTGWVNRRGRPLSATDVDENARPVILSGAELVAWAAHMAAHTADPRPDDAEPGERNDEWTTSAGAEGLWHGVGFRDEAAGKLGLLVTEGKKGWSETELPEGLYADEVAKVDAALVGWEPEAARQKTRGPHSFACKCDKLPTTLPAGLPRPRLIRVTAGVGWPEGKTAPSGIACEYCNSEFESREAPSRRTGSTR